jgi:hypothetical protein
MCKEAAVTLINALSLHFFEGTEENYENHSAATFVVHTEEEKE